MLGGGQGQPRIETAYVAQLPKRSRIQRPKNHIWLLTRMSELVKPVPSAVVLCSHQNPQRHCSGPGHCKLLPTINVSRTECPPFNEFLSAKRMPIMHVSLQASQDCVRVDQALYAKAAEGSLETREVPRTLSSGWAVFHHNLQSPLHHRYEVSGCRSLEICVWNQVSAQKDQCQGDGTAGGTTEHETAQARVMRTDMRACMERLLPWPRRKTFKGHTPSGWNTEELNSFPTQCFSGTFKS
ncbi:hypothetical protein GWK47_049940 [Chionoecetes opilio]|uniref:Uncharacterized protein n=1 Tax=Chionoecetes opilio TaxID=41210 RepID=A0A8J4YAK3_CHIOP|nr:hypothetical protein GWK47_049940 [Chionoecetes opilio]